MKEKILTLLTLIFIAMSITGFTYAQWNDTIVVKNTMSFGYWALNMAFVEPLTCTEYHTNPITNELKEGEYLGKEVGSCDCEYDDWVIDPDTNMGGYKTLTITINNAYPSYEVHCNYTLQNIGLLTLHINETVISDPNTILTWDPAQDALVNADGNPVIEITTTPTLVCNTLDPEQKAKFEMSIHITDYAQECHTYTFQVQIMYEEA
ncbi:MAG: hypothetical protein OEY88_05310 [Candidatus Bathyarchaeota archaeon]|nr:hypothetical protein [Candidatus Bathyarchaeota archaeon]